jgi:hypothetical protein
VPIAGRDRRPERFPDSRVQALDASVSVAREGLTVEQRSVAIMVQVAGFREGFE